MNSLQTESLHLTRRGWFPVATHPARSPASVSRPTPPRVEGRRFPPGESRRPHSTSRHVAPCS
jgi:hypothetical protein